MPEDDDFDYDEVLGSHKKKPKLARLNKKKLPKEELDEMFGGELYDN